MAFTLDTEARGLLPFYAILVQLHTFTVLRQNALTFTLPPPYAGRPALHTSDQTGPTRAPTSRKRGRRCSKSTPVLERSCTLAPHRRSVTYAGYALRTLTIVN